MLRLAVYGGALMLPTAILSGVLFTWIGTALQAELRTAARTTGLLTLANTTGAAAGSLLAGFVLLPLLGMENALALLAIAYGSAAILLPHAKRSRFVAPAVWVLALALFPRGSLQARFSSTSSPPIGRSSSPSARGRSRPRSS